MNETLIDFRNVSVCHQDVTVLKNIDIKVGEKELVYLIGRVGSGKSSFLKSLYCETSVEVGDAFVLGYDLNEIREKDVPYLRRKLGIVFQDFKLLTDRCVYDNLEFVLRATDMKSKKDIDSRIEEVLKYVGMSTKGYKMPHELSGGEQQRIVIARALLNKPKLLLADEPTGNLDPQTGEALMDLLYKIANSGTAVVMATHNMRWVKQFPGRVVKCGNATLTEISADDIETGLSFGRSTEDRFE